MSGGGSGGAAAAGKARPRRRLSRTFSRARWREYRRLLEIASAHGYRVVSLEDWISDDPISHGVERTLIVRHDVDRHPRSALVMAAIEEDLGHRSTWYFRWRTAHARVVEHIRARGFAVGLHYETLSRRVLQTGLGPSDDLSTLIDESRELLRAELAVFADRHGPVRSACPHGDSRVPWIHNGVLLREQNLETYGIEFDGNEAMRGRKLGYWLTDRPTADGGWKDQVDPSTLLPRGVSPILCLTHPDNWASGPSVGSDRVLARLIHRDGGEDDPALGGPTALTGSDELPP